MKIFLTGSSGCLGQYFVKHFPVQTDSLILGTTSDQSGGRVIFSNLYSNVQEQLANEDVNAVVHFASVIPSSFDSADFSLFKANTEMMNNLVEFSVKKKISKFIYLSTFGSMEHPSKNDCKDLYTISKVAGEHFCSFLNSKGVSAVSLRIPSHYGEFNTRRNVIQIFTDLALQNKAINVYGSGKRSQNFIYAGDISNCIQHCLNNNVQGVYGLTSLKNTSMLQLAKAIVEIAESKSEIIVGAAADPLENAPGVQYSEIPSTLDFGFKTTFSLEEGLRQYVGWRKENFQ